MFHVSDVREKIKFAASGQDSLSARQDAAMTACAVLDAALERGEVKIREVQSDDPDDFKLIRNSFANYRCKGCRKPVPVGADVYWRPATEDQRAATYDVECFEKKFGVEVV